MAPTGMTGGGSGGGGGFPGGIPGFGGGGLAGGTSGGGGLAGGTSGTGSTGVPSTVGNTNGNTPSNGNITINNTNQQQQQQKQKQQQDQTGGGTNTHVIPEPAAILTAFLGLPVAFMVAQRSSRACPRRLVQVVYKPDNRCTTSWGGSPEEVSRLFSYRSAIRGDWGRQAIDSVDVSASRVSFSHGSENRVHPPT